MIKMIALDIDGTLINSNGEISRYVKYYIDKAKDKDIVFTLISGRNYNDMKPYVEELSIKGMIGSVNGAEIIDTLSERIVKKERISKEIAIKIIEKCKKENLNYINFTNKNVYCEINADRKIYKNYFKSCIGVTNIYKNIDVEGTSKIMVIGEHQKLVKLKKSLIEEDYKLNIDFSCLDLMELYSCKVNKGIALEMISEYYNIKINEIACIGDSENDIYMFDKVKYSVAMENALPEVKNKALYITKSNDDDGVAYALKELIRKYK